MSGEPALLNGTLPPDVVSLIMRVHDKRHGLVLNCHSILQGVLGLCVLQSVAIDTSTRRCRLRPRKRRCFRPGPPAVDVAGNLSLFNLNLGRSSAAAVVPIVAVPTASAAPTSERLIQVRNSCTSRSSQKAGITTTGDSYRVRRGKGKAVRSNWLCTSNDLK